MTEQTPNKADLLLPLTMAAMSNSYDNEETADEDGFPDDSPQKKSNPTKKQERVENSQNDTPVLDKFGNDITKAAEEGNLDPVVGRATEIERVIQILSRRKKNNPVLIGEPGVGKSAIVEGLAIRIKEHKVSRLLFDKRIISLDMAAVVAGTKFRGQFEERIKAIIDEAKKNPNVILFIDEIHRLSRHVEEILYPAMEDFAIDIVTGKGQMATSYHLQLPKFTLIGATTRAGQLSAPLRDRFGVVLRLEMYNNSELASIVKRSASILKAKYEDDAILEIASRSRGTPRIANRLLKRVRDFALVMNDGKITHDAAKEALDRLGIDALGLDWNDRRILDTIIRLYGGGPIGLETLAAAIGEEAITIEDVYEPFLMQIGFLNRTPRGRCVTEAAYNHMGYNKQEKLWR